MSSVIWHQPRRQYSFREFRVDMMGKILSYGMVGLAVLETASPGMLEMAGGAALLLVLLGLVSGFMNQIEDVGTRTAYYVLAATLPTIADSMNAVPVVGGYVDSFLDNIAMAVAGVAIMSVLLQVKKMVMEA